jgi:hypothetical protein
MKSKKNMLHWLQTSETLNLTNKEKWAKADKIAKICGLEKNQIFYKLDEIEQSTLAQIEILNPDAIEHVRKLCIKNETSSQLKLAIWFVEKIGSYEAALELLQKLEPLLKKT